MNFRQFCTTALLLVPLTSFSRGPVGIGNLEIGMSRTAVEGLAADDGVHLSSPLTPYESKYDEAKPDEDKFNAMLATPFSKDSLKAILTFSNGSLKSIYLNLGNSSIILDQVKEMIAAKYGQPKIDNSIKEEQCIYKGGANFKVSSGSLRYHWSQDRANAEPILVSLSDTIIDTCPSDLRYATAAIQSRNLNIRVAEPAKAVVNPF